MKIFLFFFWKAIKIAGSAQKTGSVGLVETRVFCFRSKQHNRKIYCCVFLSYPVSYIKKAIVWPFLQSKSQNGQIMRQSLFSKYVLLYPRHLCRGVYSFRLSVHPFVCSFVLPSRSWNYFKVLRASNSSVVYLTNYSSESIHIWNIGILEGRLSFHDSSPQGPCPGVGLEVKI